MARRKLSNRPAERKPQPNLLQSFRPLFICAALCVVVLCGWVIRTQTEFGTRLNTLIDQNLAASGWRVDHVNITGLNHLSEKNINDTLAITPDRSIFSYDLSALQAALQTIPWVNTAHITRQFPDTLRIKISERVPIAIYHDGTDTPVLIDTTGAVLLGGDAKQTDKFLHITGVDAPLAAMNLITAIADYPNIAVRIVRAVRISARRWDLQLSDKMTIRLPEDAQLPDALRQLPDLLAKTKTGNTVDLRIIDKPAIL